MDIAKISESKNFRTIITIVVALVVALFIFQAGVFVGYRKAIFTSELGDNYYRAFAPNNQGMMGGDNIPGGHGAVGKVVKISLPTFIIEGPDNIEKQVLLTDDTIIRHFKNTISQNDIKVGDYVVVIGSPDQNGQVEAKLIRLLPPPIVQNASSTPATSTSNQSK